MKTFKMLGLQAFTPWISGPGIVGESGRIGSVVLGRRSMHSTLVQDVLDTQNLFKVNNYKDTTKVSASIMSPMIDNAYDYWSHQV